MRGIATVDRQPGAISAAIWITNRSTAAPRHPSHVNAVVLDLDNDPHAMLAVRSLTRDCAVLLTEGSESEGLPIDGEPLFSCDIESLIAETQAQQSAILDAIAAHKLRTRSSPLVTPVFGDSPVRSSFTPVSDTPAHRALATANFVATSWLNWLTTDEERRRRTTQPRTNKTPWVMPEKMNQPTVPDFPAAFADRLHLQPLI